MATENSKKYVYPNKYLQANIEKEREAVGIGMVGKKKCLCGATEGGPIQGCYDCEIYKVSSGMWWSEAGWAVKDDL